MPKIPYAGYFGLSLAISAQFTLEMCVAAQNREKFIKTSFFGLQGHSKSSMLTFLSRMSVPSCNHFHARRASIDSLTFFYGIPFFHNLIRGKPLHPAA